ncbi:hypothetical protein ZYGR_0A02090 [Zygosaccharomyces rouxii]|uniref:ZYRO0A04752p n=2 Tax=Zygosaccharomyces rouxii TaxID=4956 RepID=C5DPN3_ZYGRC|nr:uncharacterized protein ZYRO0A04752g [Zygosaccharomyces rouxii]KAH9198836.1 hypothetical protein LQ764DRAFT_142293 [Zygosaccharomyces rouxii]GAV46616.1 hypothetical protein ZYGR_0A02090 [Zygosaccharomyces rouxii]CAR25644.1 ZYRO0A04752p [Zygosaccharomyces rouxii]
MDTDPLEILSLYQYESGRHSSVVSFQSVQTAERLLDKLELSAEDERLLQLALKEEREKNEAEEKERNRVLQREKDEEADAERQREREKEREQSPLLCLPASGFPSLKNRSFVTPRRVLTVSVADPLGQGDKGLCTGAEQHLPTKSRYSYFVEEVDSEDEDNDTHDNQPSPRPKKPSLGTNPRKKTVRAEIYGAFNVGVAPIQRSNTTATETAPVSRSTSRKTVNFEKYRMDTSKLLSKSPSSKKAKLYENNSNNSSSTEFGQNSLLFRSQQSLSDESEGSIDGSSVKRNNSSATTKVSSGKDSTTASPLHIFNTATSYKSDGGDSLQNSNKETPTKATLTRDTPTKNTPTKDGNGRSHSKKKTSFHLKNLFRSQKASGRKDSLNSKRSTDDLAEMSAMNSANTSATTSVGTSAANSPPKGTPFLNNANKSPLFRKFAFPTNTTEPLEDIPSSLSSSSSSAKQGSRMQTRDTQHYRSLSDHHAINKSSSIPTITNANTQPFTPGLRNRKLSLDSRHNAGRVSRFDTPLTSDNNNNNSTNNNNNEDRIHDAAGSAIHSSPSLHSKRTNIANLGESARKLHDACNDGNAEACFLYGMALRHGYGVIPDQEESFHYLFTATGLKSELHDVFEVEINPFELERNQSIPEIAPEPSAPAIYECAISYLKGYGMDHEDEIKGLKFLEKVASMGHLDAMCLSGTIWSKKSSVRRKDLARAAAWFRIAEKRGAHLIGAEWIYKDKYIQMAKNY